MYDLITFPSTVLVPVPGTGAGSVQNHISSSMIFFLHLELTVYIRTYLTLCERIAGVVEIGRAHV